MFSETGKVGMAPHKPALANFAVWLQPQRSLLDKTLPPIIVSCQNGYLLEKFQLYLQIHTVAYIPNIEGFWGSNLENVEKSIHVNPVRKDFDTPST